MLQLKQMSEDINIQKLADLARIDLDDNNSEELKENISEVLSYVESVQEIAPDDEGVPEAGLVHNVLREDKNPHEPGAWREEVLREAPVVDENGFIVVPPIL